MPNVPNERFTLAARGPFPVSEAEAHRRLRHTVNPDGVLPEVEPLSWLLLPQTNGPIDPIGPVPHERARGNTALHLALLYGWFDVAGWFLPVSDLQAQNRDGDTPLMLALRQPSPDLEVLDALLAESDLTQMNAVGLDAMGTLMRATDSSRGLTMEGLMTILRRWPESLDRLDARGMNAAHQAVIHGSAMAVQALREATPVAVWRAMLRRMTSMLAPNDRMDGGTPLGLAVSRNKPAWAEHLVADSDPLQESGAGLSAWAMGCVRVDLAPALLDMMALHVPETIAAEALRERGADVMPRYHRLHELRQLQAAADDALPEAPAHDRPRL